jgi:hypothetical protein
MRYRINEGDDFHGLCSENQSCTVLPFPGGDLLNDMQRDQL